MMLVPRLNSEDGYLVDATYRHGYFSKESAAHCVIVTKEPHCTWSMLDSSLKYGTSLTDRLLTVLKDS